VSPVAGRYVEDLASAVSDVTERFYTAMDDDFDSPAAVAALFDFARVINRAKAEGADEDSVATAQNWLRHFSGVLGLELELPAESAGDAAPFIDLLLSLRQDLRAAKQWALADKIRDQLLELGITIEDQASGSIWRAT
jgi:cysteinyl-tRNA synthetase